MATQNQELRKRENNFVNYENDEKEKKKEQKTLDDFEE